MLITTTSLAVSNESVNCEAVTDGSMCSFQYFKIVTHPMHATQGTELDLTYKIP
jgi:hypothetical protein